MSAAVPVTACEECRRRKSRCDQARPRCGGCVELGNQCAFPREKKKRGPKKGQLQMLRSQLVDLQDQLAMHNNFQATNHFKPDKSWPEIHNTPRDLGDTSTDTQPLGPLNMDLNELDLTIGNDFLSESISQDIWADRELMSTESSLFTCSTSASEPPPVAGSTCLSPLAWTELEQVFFERAYHSAPIVQEQRYRTWSRQAKPLKGGHCLRLAMCTLATAFSAAYQDLGENLYQEAHQLLEALDSNDSELPWQVHDFETEHLQAWALLVLYQLMRKGEEEALAVAGQAFRLAQISCLRYTDCSQTMNMSDDSNKDTTLTPTAFVAAEEKRRTIWVFYCLDRLLKKDDLAWSLQDEIIRLRVPAPEEDFQRSRPVLMDFLPDAIAKSRDTSLSSLANHVVLSTIYGRCITHRRLTCSTASMNTGSNAFWARHNWLSDIMKTESYKPEETSSGINPEPSAMFSELLRQEISIHLHDTGELWLCHSLQQNKAPFEYQQVVLEKTKEAAQRVKLFGRLGALKMHPLVPRFLETMIPFLIKHSNTHREEVEIIRSALSQLEAVNKPLKERMLAVPYDMLM